MCRGRELKDVKRERESLKTKLLNHSWWRKEEIHRETHTQRAWRGMRRKGKQSFVCESYLCPVIRLIGLDNIVRNCDVASLERLVFLYLKCRVRSRVLGATDTHWTHCIAAPKNQAQENQSITQESCCVRIQLWWKESSENKILDNNKNKRKNCEKRTEKKVVGRVGVRRRNSKLTGGPGRVAAGVARVREVDEEGEWIRRFTIGAELGPNQIHLHLDLRQIPGSRDGILDGPRRISRKNGPIPNWRREWRSISKHGIRRWHQYLQALESQTLSPSAAIL